MTFRGLQDESAAQARIHRGIARDLQTLVADPFNNWAQDYKVAGPAACYARFILTPSK